jgi:hypothetical protein
MKYSEIIREGTKRITVWSGATIPVLHNPTKSAFDNFTKKHKALRGLITLDGKEVWLWNAHMAIHPNMMQELGLDRVDCIAYTNGRWGGPVGDVMSDVYAPAIQRLTPKIIQRWASDISDDELLRLLKDF